VSEHLTSCHGPITERQFLGVRSRASVGLGSAEFSTGPKPMLPTIPIVKFSRLSQFVRLPTEYPANSKADGRDEQPEQFES
jgi:hypothetical protein